ncbi:hypothetical protein N7449_003470 [Penicillium cf. viridicatum]|uniref:RRM domain-containing protein n=1 Tax=Penicillium cf. viridicatum TaxID=2972119 RepID=A0A9W9T4K6_9EURO|nr:hypothetical protein N7449_003470 [Penicillium cf. viridicatum]
MLKPFQIRNLRVSTQSQPEQLTDPRTPTGVVQISATDYDDLASNHPRARLTYMDDDDDDETITVGSALELSQRLEEPLDINTQLESVEISPGDISPMHIFDIRRSNSVTELWKRFDDNVPKQDLDDKKNGTQATSNAIVLEEQHEVPVPHITTSPSVSGNEHRPLMEAFEAELAEILNAAESLKTRVPQPNSPPTTEPSANTNSERSPHPVEIIAAQVLEQLINGATMVQSEWRSKIPELQRQLQNAQRQFETAQKSLPVNVEASLRTLLATVEAHLRTAFNNLPDGGRQMAEDAFQAGRPVAENAADGFRMMASELNEVGRTLFAAFESEFGRAASTTHTSTSTSEMPNPGASGPFFNTAANNGSTAPGTMYSQTWNANPPSTATNEKSTAGPDQSTASNTTQTGVPPFQSRHGPPAPAPPPPAFNAPLNATHTSQVKSGESKNGPITKSLFIGNVGFKVTDKMIQDVFAAKGFLVKVDLPLDTESGGHAGFGYVNFPSDYPAFAAMESLQGAVIDGHSINLEPMYHPPIESVRPAHISPNAGTTTHDTQTDRPQAETSDAVWSPLDVKQQKSPSEPGKTDNRRKSVSFVDLTQSVDLGQSRTESSALLDSPSEDPAFSARFPSLLPETSAQHNDPLSGRGVSSDLHTESRFPPVSQWEAQLLANRQERSGTAPITDDLHSQSPNNPKHREGPSTHGLPLYPTPKAFSRPQPASHLDAAANLSSVVDAGRPSDHSKAIRDQIGHSSGSKETVRPVVDVNGPQSAPKLRRRATEHKTHKPNHWHAAETDRHSPLKHSASMRRLGDRSHGPAETDTWARLSRRERNGASSHEQIPGSFPVEHATMAEISKTLDTSAIEAEDAAIEQCASALVDIGYGDERAGGRSRMAVYAAMANGDLMDAIDMIEEERSIYERRSSQ